MFSLFKMQVCSLIHTNLASQIPGLVMNKTRRERVASSFWYVVYIDGKKYGP